jgi:CheY-like chemotaxis protein
MRKVLIVEDNLMIAECLEEILVDAGYTVCGIASHVAEAIRMGKVHNPDLVVIDLHLAGGGNGAEVGAAFKAQGRTGVVYVSGNPDDLQLSSTDGDGCVAKPYSATSIIAALNTASKAITTLLMLPPQAKGLGHVSI